MHRPIVSIPNAAIEDVCKIKIKKEPFLCKKDMTEEEKKIIWSHVWGVFERRLWRLVLIQRWRNKSSRRSKKIYK